MAKTTFIYGLKDPRSGEIHYVGKANDPQTRLKQHLADDKTNPGRVRWIDDLADNRLEPELVILAEVDHSEWSEAERGWIAKGREEGWPLTNILPGGEGASEQIKPDYTFMQSWIHPDLWERFEAMDYDQQDEVCLRIARAMAVVRLPILEYKIATGQREMFEINEDELVQVGLMAASVAVQELHTQR